MFGLQLWQTKSKNWTQLPSWKHMEEEFFWIGLGSICYLSCLDSCFQTYAIISNIKGHFQSWKSGFMFELELKRDRVKECFSFKAQLLENSQLALMDERRGWNANFTIWVNIASPTSHQNSPQELTWNFLVTLPKTCPNLRRVPVRFPAS